MIFGSKMNGIFFSGGARRPSLKDQYAEDSLDTLMFDLDDLDLGWETRLGLNAHQSSTRGCHVTVVSRTTAFGYITAL